MNGESSREACTLPYIKWIAGGNLLSDSGNSNRGSVMAWKGEMMGMVGRFRMKGTCVHLWLIHIDVRQKPA